MTTEANLQIGSLDTVPIPIIPQQAPKAELKTPEATAEFPLIEATDGPGAVDIASFVKQTGRTVYDNGFMNTASTTSAITFIDGEAGILRYRGYPIEQLAEQASFLEVAWLLIYGELPTDAELSTFKAKIQANYLVDEGVLHAIDALPRNAPPMAVLGNAVSTLSMYHQDVKNPLDPAQTAEATAILIGQLPTIIAASHKHASGQAIMYPLRELDYVDNFLQMMFGTKVEQYRIEPIVSAALESLLILHEDHEQNASTSALRNVSSTQADIFTSVVAAIGALSGPKHGGANEAVLAMLEQIRDSGQSVQSFVDGVKSSNSGIRLMGFGHRIYKNYDPRARLVRDSARRVLDALGIQDDLLDIASELEQIALADAYFIERKLYPNVDFYTGIMYKAMGFPTQQFTVLFALGRLPGWIAHWSELVNDTEAKILRPRQVYTGKTERDYPGRG